MKAITCTYIEEVERELDLHSLVDFDVPGTVAPLWVLVREILGRKLSFVAFQVLPAF